MRAVVVTTYGGPDVLQLRDLPEPQAGPGQVVIRVAYAGVNYAEIMGRRGDYHATSLPFTPGLEVAGVISAIGEGVAGLRVGQPVAAFTGAGGYAELAVASAALTFPLDTIALPVDLAQAAAYPTIVPTAYALLAEVARIRSGESVLIHAAAGGVGTVAAQMARHLGAGLVLGTVSTNGKVAYARAFGYDQVLAREGFVEAVRALTGNHGVDVVLESIGGQVFTQSLEVLAPLGRLVIFGNATASPDQPVSPLQLQRTNKAVLGFSIGSLRTQAPQQLKAIAQQALALVAEAGIRIDITEVFPLSKAAEAHQRIESRSTTGKLLLQVQEPQAGSIASE
jgi:NADPH2:quinone reductase